MWTLNEKTRAWSLQGCEQVLNQPCLAGRAVEQGLQLSLDILLLHDFQVMQRIGLVPQPRLLQPIDDGELNVLQALRKTRLQVASAW